MDNTTKSDIRYAWKILTMDGAVYLSDIADIQKKISLLIFYVFLADGLVALFASAAKQISNKISCKEFTRS